MENTEVIERESESYNSPSSGKRPQMKYFRKTGKLDTLKSLLMQRKKPSNFERLTLLLDRRTSFGTLKQILKTSNPRLKSLTKLRIDGIEDITNPSFQTILHLMQYRSKSVQRIHVYLDGNPQFPIPQKPLLHFIGNYASRLQSLTLDFMQSFKLYDQDLKKIAGSMKKNLRTLQCFNFNSGDCRMITDRGLAYLVNRFSKSEVLQQLNLIFATQAGFVSRDGLPFSVEKNAQGLRHFGLRILAVENVTNETIKLISSTFGKKKTLCNLDLRSYFCRNINDNSLKVLAEAFTFSFEALQNLKVNFSGSPVSDEGFKPLVTSIGNSLPSLKSLDLLFYYCSRVTDQGIEVLDEQFQKNSKRLESFEFYFLSSGVTGRGNSILRSLKSFCLEGKEPCTD